MKKKIIIILIAVLFIFGLWKLIFYISNKDLIDKGNNLYGREKCECNIYELKISVPMMTPWICELCGVEDIESHTDIPTLCDKCSKITNRCDCCGERIYFINKIENMINLYWSRRLN